MRPVDAPDVNKLIDRRLSEERAPRPDCPVLGLRPGGPPHETAHADLGENGSGSGGVKDAKANLSSEEQERLPWPRLDCRAETFGSRLEQGAR